MEKGVYQRALVQGKPHGSCYLLSSWKMFALLKDMECHMFAKRKKRKDNNL